MDQCQQPPANAAQHHIRRLAPYAALPRTACLPPACRALNTCQRLPLRAPLPPPAAACLPCAPPYTLYRAFAARRTCLYALCHRLPACLYAPMPAYCALPFYASTGTLTCAAMNGRRGVTYRQLACHSRKRNITTCCDC